MSNYNSYSDPMMEMLAEARKIVAEAKSAAIATAPAATTEATSPATHVLKRTDSVKPLVFPAAPATTYEQSQKYGATPYRCGCPDRAARNGSYTGLDGRPACKHMLHMQRYYTDIAI